MFIWTFHFVNASNELSQCFLDNWTAYHYRVVCGVVLFSINEVPKGKFVAASAKNSIQNIISLDSDPAARTKVSTQRNALEFNYQKSIDLVTAQRSQNMIFQKMMMFNVITIDFFPLSPTFL